MYPSSDPERWDKIADGVPSRTRRECLARFKVNGTLQRSHVKGLCVVYCWHVKRLCVVYCCHVKGLCVVYCCHVKRLCVVYCCHVKGLCVVYCCHVKRLCVVYCYHVSAGQELVDRARVRLKELEKNAS